MNLRILGKGGPADPVVKSCNRVPTARITSAFSAIAFALSDPVTPMGPIFSGWVASMLARPAMVSTTGKLVGFGKTGQLVHRAGILHSRHPR